MINTKRLTVANFFAQVLRDEINHVQVRNVRLIVKSALDQNEYPTGIKVTDKELRGINLVSNEFCGQWNYTIYPIFGA